MTHTATPQDPPARQAPDRQRRELLLAGMALGLTACSREEAAGPAGQAAAASAAASQPHATTPVNAPDITANAMLLPGLVNSADDGPFIDLVKAIGEVYKGGRIQISVAPVGRVTDNVSRGLVDLGFPTLRFMDDSEAKLPYRLTTASFGRVNFVLYSNKAKPLTRGDLNQALARGNFSYGIEAPTLSWGFPTLRFTNFESALRKVEAGRIDALLWAQEEADSELRRLGLHGIHRESYGDFEDVMMLPRTPRGAFVDNIVSTAIAQLQKSGRLQELYRKIHLPHNPWQP